MTDRYDVVIMGGGAAGLTLALQLKKSRPDLTVMVVERLTHPVPETAHKVGESTVEIAAHYLRSVLGMGEHLKDKQLNKYGLRIFFSDGDNRDITQRVELGHSVLPPHGVGTYQIDRGRLENALGEELLKLGVDFRSGIRVLDATLSDGTSPHLVRLALGEGEKLEVEARWLIDATGRSAMLKRRLGLARRVDHEANAVWFRVGHPIDIDTWSDDPGWHARIREGRRELSTNHLMGPGYWVWLIRLAPDAISIGIVTDARMHRFDEMNRLDRALGWLGAHEPQCADVVSAHLDKVRDFRVMKDYSYSCEQVFSDQRWALAGEAGVFLDPFYSPGLDLIAISNGLITDLVNRDLAGEDIEEVAAIHNHIFLLIANGWLRVYDQQYPLMGNARITLAKVIWDTAVYWAVPGLLFFHDAVRKLAQFPQIIADLARFTVASEATQRFFREWHEVDRSVDANTFVSFYDFAFMRDLHIGMTAGLSDAELPDRFSANVRFIEQLSGQLVARVLAELRAADGDQRVRELVERWAADEHLCRLVQVYEQDRDRNPVSDDWITLKQPARIPQEIAR